MMLVLFDLSDNDNKNLEQSEKSVALHHMEVIAGSCIVFCRFLVRFCLNLKREHPKPYAAWTWIIYWTLLVQVFFLNTCSPLSCFSYFPCFEWLFLLIFCERLLRCCCFLWVLLGRPWHHIQEHLLFLGQFCKWSFLAAHVYCICCSDNAVL